MTVAVEGAELFYSTRGSGPVCLVLTSMGTTIYERQMPRQLTDQSTLAFVDLRGSGRSTGNPSDLTFDLLAADLEAVRVDLGVERVAVLGHSVVGALAIEYARRCPARVSHVIAVGTPTNGDMAGLAAQAAAFFAQDASDDRKQVLRENLARLPADPSVIESFMAQMPMRFFDARIDAGPLFAEADYKPRIVMHLMGTMLPGWDITVDPGSLITPILIAHGRCDYIVPYTPWTVVAPTLPRATLRLFERSGHQPFFEEPDEFAAAVTEWLRRDSARPPAVAERFDNPGVGRR